MPKITIKQTFVLMATAALMLLWFKLVVMPYCIDINYDYIIYGFRFIPYSTADKLNPGNITNTIHEFLYGFGCLLRVFYEVTIWLIAPVIIIGTGIEFYTRFKNV